MIFSLVVSEIGYPLAEEIGGKTVGSFQGIQHASFMVGLF
jgi:hypothetical protein